MEKNRGKIRLSIFVSILFPLVLALVLINVVLTVSIRPHLFRPPGPGGPGPGGHDHHERFEQVLNRFSQNPSAENVRKLLGNEPVDFVLEVGDHVDKTDPSLPQWKDIKNSSDAQDNSRFIRGRHENRFFMAKETPEGILILFPPFREPPSPVTHPFFWVNLAVQVLCVLLLCYAILFWQLRPLTKLSQGVAELSQGNLGHRLPIQGTREFSLLSEGFNDMAEKFGRMIHAKEELVLGVSHELRSPIASMKVAVEMMDDGRRKDQMKVYLSQMESMVTELLESYQIASKHSQLHTTHIKVGYFFDELNRRYEKPSIPLAFKCDPTLQVTADPRLLERLFTNLIDNALKYSKGTVGPITIEAKAQGNSIQFDISDTGPGIPSEDLLHIFEPFYRVDKSRNKETGGFGLGLYLCKKIAEAHGGTLTASNRASAGAVFSLRLPTDRPLS